MKLKIIDDKFYVVKIKENKWFHDNKDEGIETLKEEIEKNPELSSGDFSVIEVDTSTEKWGLKMVPWDEIVIGLIRGEKDGSKKGKG